MIGLESQVKKKKRINCAPDKVRFTFCCDGFDKGKKGRAVDKRGFLMIIEG